MLYYNKNNNNNNKHRKLSMNSDNEISPIHSNISISSDTNIDNYNINEESFSYNNNNNNSMNMNDQSLTETEMKSNSILWDILFVISSTIYGIFILCILIMITCKLSLSFHMNLWLRRLLAYTFLVTFSLTFWIFIFGLLYKQNTHIIKVRSPLLILLSGISGWMIFIWLCLIAIFPNMLQSYIYCSIFNTFINLSYPCFVIPYYLRCFRIWYCFGVFNRKLRLTEHNLLKWLLLLMIPFIIFIILFNSTSAYINLLPVCHSHSIEYFNSVWLILMSIEMIGFTISIYVLTHVDLDDYAIKSEIYCCSFTTLLVDTIICIVRWKEQDIQSAQETIILLILFRICLFIFYSIVYPLYSHDNHTFRYTHLATVDIILSFSELIRDPVCFPYFHEHCVRSNHGDILKFWTEIELFKHETDETILKLEASQIYQKYIESGRVRLTEITKSELHMHLYNSLNTEITPHLYDQAQNEIEDYIEQHLYSDFLQTDLCHELLSQITQQQKLIKNLVRHEIL